MHEELRWRSTKESWKYNEKRQSKDQRNMRIFEQSYDMLIEWGDNLQIKLYMFDLNKLQLHRDLGNWTNRS